jgi:hypothetical protein
VVRLHYIPAEVAAPAPVAPDDRVLTLPEGSIGSPPTSRQDRGQPLFHPHIERGALDLEVLGLRGRVAEPDGVAVRVFHVELAHSPGLVGRGHHDAGALRSHLLVERVRVVHEDRHPGAVLPLSATTEKDLDVVSLDAPEVGRLAPVPPPPGTDNGPPSIHRLALLLRN